MGILPLATEEVQTRGNIYLEYLDRRLIVLELHAGNIVKPRRMSEAPVVTEKVFSASESERDKPPGCPFASLDATQENTAGQAPLEDLEPSSPTANEGR